MKRRDFVVASGSALLTGCVAGVKRPAVGLEFEISSVEDFKPTNVDTILIKITKLQLVPNYLDDSENIEVTVNLELTDGNLFSKTATGINFSNGETLSISKIASRSGTNLSQIQATSLDESGSSVRGTCSIELKHPDIPVESYNQKFRVSRRNVIENFEDGDLSEYSSGYIFGDTQSGTGENGISSSTTNSGNFSGYVNSKGNRFHGIFTTSESKVSPSRGDVFEGYCYSDTQNDWWPVVLFGFQNQGSHYASKSASNGEKIGLEVIEEGSRTELGTKDIDRVLPVNDWFKSRVEWLESGKIIFTVYDITGSEIESLTVNDMTYSDGGFGFGVYDNNGDHFNYYDDWKIV